MHLAMKDKELVGQAAASISLTFIYTFDKVEAKVATYDSGLLKTKHAEMLPQHGLQAFSEGSPKGMSSTTIEMLPCHRVRLPNALPNGLGQLLLHPPTLLVTAGLTTIGTSIGSTSRARAQPFPCSPPGASSDHDPGGSLG